MPSPFCCVSSVPCRPFLEPPRVQEQWWPACCCVTPTRMTFKIRNQGHPCREGHGICWTSCPATPFGYLLPRRAREGPRNAGRQRGQAGQGTEHEGTVQQGKG